MYKLKCKTYKSQLINFTLEQSSLPDLEVVDGTVIEIPEDDIICDPLGKNMDPMFSSTIGSYSSFNTL